MLSNEPGADMMLMRLNRDQFILPRDAYAFWNMHVTESHDVTTLRLFGECLVAKDSRFHPLPYRPCLPELFVLCCTEFRV